MSVKTWSLATAGALVLSTTLAAPVVAQEGFGNGFGQAFGFSGGFGYASDRGAFASTGGSFTSGAAGYGFGTVSESFSSGGYYGGGGYYSDFQSGDFAAQGIGSGAAYTGGSASTYAGASGGFGYARQQTVSGAYGTGFGVGSPFGGIVFPVNNN